ncbi:uncharacterized protein LOC133176642 [Saccostrea echinata]|uniref:uncharacterized protein LOC133176642 n=1 Tax=Saccostrea echinata TaxID=191078 RepID=UPI002A7EAD4E|nr:uncharacterized protein LOC133176642 [Saccostrea echinata]
MFCMECGRSLADFAKFCGNCGAQVQHVKDKDSATSGSRAIEVGCLSPDAKKSLAILKAKYLPKKKEIKEKKGERSSVNEIQIQIMDGKKKALKRAFPSETGLTGTLKMPVKPGENAKDWMKRLTSQFRGKISFVPFIMGPGGLQELSEPAAFNIENLSALKTQRKAKIYALAKGKGEKSPIISSIIY